MSADADLRGQAEHVFAESHERHLQRSDVHGQRQLRYLQRAGLGRRHPLFRHRTAHDVDPVGGQRSDVETTDKQCRARPHDTGVGYAQPDPFPVGDRDLADGGVGGQNALDAVDPYLTVLASTADLRRRKRNTTSRPRPRRRPAPRQAGRRRAALWPRQIGSKRLSYSNVKTDRRVVRRGVQRKRRVEPDRTEPCEIAQACADAHLEFLRKIRE